MSDARAPAIDLLITRHLDGDLDQAGRDELEAWILADPAHRRTFLAAVQVHQGLRGRTGARQARRRLRRPQARRIGRILVGMTLVAALVALALLWWEPRRAPGGPPAPVPAAIADRGLPRLVAASDAFTAEGGITGMAQPGPLRAGERLLTTRVGTASIAYADGTTLVVDPGSELGIASADGPGAAAMTLAHGSCEAEVAHQAAGSPLRIATANAVVTVVGTHLRITATAHETLVAVSRGEVALERSTDQASITIDAGEEAVVSAAAPPLKHASGTPWGRLLAVGPGSDHPTFASLPDLAPGDVVAIAGATYAEACRWRSSGTELRPIVLRAAAGAMPWIDGAALDLSGIGAVSRALFQIEGSHYRIEGLGFRNARNHDNAAGIRLLQSADVTISGCRVQDCDDGIAGEGDGVVVDGCRITACGTATNDGYCHDCYLEAGSSLQVSRCAIDHALFGQDLKCSAHRIDIEGNRIGEAQDGEISILDQPVGEPSDTIRLLGNLVISTADRHGNHQRFIALAGEHGGQRLGSVLLAYNTLVSSDSRNVLIDLAGAPVALVACDNLLVGPGRILAGGGGGFGLANWAPAGAELPASWSGMLAGDASGLSDAATGDWRPRRDGPLAGRAVIPGSIRELPSDGRPRWQPPRSAEDVASVRTTWVDPGAWMAADDTPRR